MRNCKDRNKESCTLNLTRRRGRIQKMSWVSNFCISAADGGKGKGSEDGVSC